jgi:transposase
MRAAPSQDGDRSWSELRKQAERLFAAGERQSVVARQLGISRQCVHNWYWEWQGAASTHRPLPRRRGSGRKPRLTPAQLHEVEVALRQSPEAFGFQGQRWTLWRIAVVVKQVTGVEFHPSSVWRILRAMGWTLRRPRRRKPSGYTPRIWSAPVE